MRYGKSSIVLEVFPTTESCAAGCTHCPLSRRVDKHPSSEIHPEVFATARAIADAAHHFKQSIELVYPGNVGTLATHVNQLIQRPEQVTEIRFAYDPKDTRSFSELAKLLLEQISALNQNMKGLALNKFAGTIYPKNKFRPTLVEQKFLIATLQKMKELTTVSQERCEYVVELHANMIPHKEYVKKFPTFESGDSKLFDNLFPQLHLFGKPTAIVKNFLLLNDHGYCFSGKLSLAGFDPSFKKVVEVKTRYITKTEYEAGTKERDRQLHQGITLINERSNHNVFSPTPEGVMIMHSSLHITNPVIWIGHEEFREVLAQAVEKNIPLKTFARNILISNWELMKKQPSTLHYMKSMQLFRTLRKEHPIIAETLPVAPVAQA